MVNKLKNVYVFWIAINSQKYIMIQLTVLKEKFKGDYKKLKQKFYPIFFGKVYPTGSSAGKL